MWLAWQCIVLAWQRINRSHTHAVYAYDYIARCHMIITDIPHGWLVRENSEMKRHQAQENVQCRPDPFPPWGWGLGTRTRLGKIWWHWNGFLGVQARDLTAMLCDQSRASCTLLRNGMQNHRAAFWLARAKPRQLTLYNVATQRDTKSHENRRAAIWLAYAKTWLLSLQKPRKRSQLSPCTRPFPSQMVGSG